MTTGSKEEENFEQRLKEIAGGDESLFFSLAMAQSVVGQIDRGEEKLTPGNQDSYERSIKLLLEKGLYPSPLR
jgi:hypothetical protein